MKIQPKSVVVSLVAALFAVAALSVHAADPVKSGGSLDRPARALDAETVKSQGASSKPGRAIEGEHAALPRTGKPGNELDDSTVKSRGASDRPGRAADKASK